MLKNDYLGHRLSGLLNFVQQYIRGLRTAKHLERVLKDVRTRLVS